MKCSILPLIRQDVIMLWKSLLSVFLVVMVCDLGSSQSNECQNYKTLSARNRAMNVQRGNVLKCDKTDIPTKAWYRFTGQAGNAMAISVPQKNYCGTHAPGWMKGSQPTVAQGIVERKVCYNWGSNTCNWNNDVRVRNCGGFYVYELVKPPVCHLRYCGNGQSGPIATNPPVQNEPTAEPPQGQNQPVPHKVECKTNGIVIKVEKKPLQYTISSDLRLLDPSCLPSDQGDNFVFQFDLDKCGTTVETKSTELIYRNEVLGQIVPKPKISHRIKDIRVKVQCSYPRKIELVSGNIEPNQDKFRAETEEGGKLTYNIQMFPNNKFDKPYAAFPVGLHLRQPLFVELSVKNQRQQLSILAQNCYATPTKEDGNIKYQLIEDSCPTDKTLKFLQSPTKNVQRFQVEAFRFNQNQQFVYVHCHVITCDGNKKNSVCAKGCQNEAEKREFDQSASLDTQKLSQGPIAVRHSNTDSTMEMQ